MRRPNVVLLMSDQHRAMSLGAYGSTAVKTPNLDEFAAGSVRFEKAYCQYPQCVASRQSIITGQYPSTHGAYGISMKSISPGQWTLAGAFRGSGYRSVLIGHPHCNEAGFEDNRAWHFAGRPQAEKDILKDGFFGFKYLENAKTAGPLSFPEEYLCDSWTWRETVGFLSEKPPEPFFLFVTFPKPHPPFNPPKRFWDLYRSDDIRLPPPDPNRPRHPFWSEHIMSPDLQRNYLHGYYACISFVDWCVGNVLAALREGGYLDRSVVAYTSDHGESGGYHGAYEKHCFYEPAVRVPLLVRTPGTKPRVVEEVVEVMDIAPTFTGVCGVDAGKHAFDAVSLEGLLRGEAAGWKNRAVSEYYQKKTATDGSEDVERSFGRMLVEDGFKCCLNGNMVDRNSLFDLATDPGEFKNLWDDPARRERRDRMVEFLREDWRREWYPYGTESS